MPFLLMQRFIIATASFQKLLPYGRHQCSKFSVIILNNNNNNKLRISPARMMTSLLKSNPILEQYPTGAINFPHQHLVQSGSRRTMLEAILCLQMILLSIQNFRVHLHFHPFPEHIHLFQHPMRHIFADPLQRSLPVSDRCPQHHKATAEWSHLVMRAYLQITQRRVRR